MKSISVPMALSILATTEMRNLTMDYERIAHSTIRRPILNRITGNDPLVGFAKVSDGGQLVVLVDDDRLDIFDDGELAFSGLLREL